jgi:hypothetical protein
MKKETLKSLIEEKANLLRQEFIDACERKIRSGGFDSSGAEGNHGSNGLGAVYLSALNDLCENQKGALSVPAVKAAKNLNCF